MKRPRVLIADDHTLLLDAFATLLRDECDVVGTVSDGRALVAMAADVNPDVIVLDISMPLLNGLEAARQIKAQQPLAHIPIIALTATPPDWDEKLQLFAAVLVKPCPTAQILDALTAAMPS